MNELGEVEVRRLLRYVDAMLLDMTRAAAEDSIGEEEARNDGAATMEEAQGLQTSGQLTFIRDVSDYPGIRFLFREVKIASQWQSTFSDAQSSPDDVT